MRLKIKVIPNAKQNKLVDEKGSYKVYLTAPAIEGKANKALIGFLAESFHVKKKQIVILQGEKSRNKIVEMF